MEWNKDNFRYRRWRGFNLVEAAIVLGIVGLVIGGIWVALQAVTLNRTVNKLSTLAIQVSNDIISRGSPYWGGAAIEYSDVLQKMGIMPASFTYNSTTHVYNDVESGLGLAFRISSGVNTYVMPTNASTIPRDFCINYINKIASFAIDNPGASITVYANSAPTLTVFGNAIRPTLDAITTACRNNAVTNIMLMRSFNSK